MKRSIPTRKDNRDGIGKAFEYTGKAGTMSAEEGEVEDMRSIDEIRTRVTAAAESYNRDAPEETKIVRVTLFGSYANGTQRDGSDVDLLVQFSSPIVSLFTLARVLNVMESALDMPVDLVQDPLPQDALLTIDAKVPVYAAA